MVSDSVRAGSHQYSAIVPGRRSEYWLPSARKPVCALKFKSWMHDSATVRIERRHGGNQAPPKVMSPSTEFHPSREPDTMTAPDGLNSIVNAKKPGKCGSHGFS